MLKLVTPAFHAFFLPPGVEKLMHIMAEIPQILGGISPQIVNLAPTLIPLGLPLAWDALASKINYSYT
jgi:hypothetical protein